MSLTQLEQLPAELLYSLPFDCPVGFPRVPSYPIAPAAAEVSLSAAYWDALYADKFSLDSFGRLLLSRVSSCAPDAFAAQLRALIDPLHSFDNKWRTITPRIFPPPSQLDQDESAAAEQAKALGKVKVTEDERERLLAAHAGWSQAEETKRSLKRADEEQARTLMDRDSLSAKMGAVQSDEAQVAEEGTVAAIEPAAAAVSWTQTNEQSTIDWIQQLELLETRLQATLILTLLSLPPSSIAPALPPPAVAGAKPRKSRKDPERDSATLDPELLLDFLTDRLQIWRVMKDVKSLGVSDSVASEGTQSKGEKVVLEEKKDEVQCWWEETVEALYSLRVSAHILTHHRTKLFPSSATSEDALSLRLAPPPSPFKNRSLLSLDKSARRKSFKEGQASLTDSPTMKRLLSRKMPRDQATLRAAAQGEEEGGAVFKVPLPPRRASGESQESQSASAAAAGRKNPRKQERPRPLPRGDSQSKSILNRREVSLARRPSSTALARKKSGGSGGQLDTAEASAAADGKRKRETATLGASIVQPKRKGEPPSLPFATFTIDAGKKLTSLSFVALCRSAAVELTNVRPTLGAPPRTLVPDTPQKDKSSSPGISTARSFSRTVSLPSFAQLGASFRPGAQQVDAMPRSLAGINIPPPPVLKGERRREEEEMDWEQGSDDGLGTPRGKRTNNWLVPDT